MLYKFANLYAALFAKKVFYKWNKLLFHCALRGLGIHNSSSRKRSGEEHFLRKYLTQPTQPIVFDVGANIGKYSNYILQVNPQSQIFAFEPHPKTFQKLVANISSAQIQAVHAGCGDRAGELTIYDYANNDGSSHASLYKEVVEDIYQQESLATQVQIIELDTFIQENGVTHIDLLKIDTEGHELAVLKGAKNAIEQGIIHAIHFEFNAMNIISRTFFKDFMQLLPTYTFYRMLPNGLHKIEKYDPVYDEIFAFQNIVALKSVASN